MKKLIIFYVIVLIMPQMAKALTFENAVQTTLENNQNLTAAQEYLNAAGASARIKLGELLPQLKLTGSARLTDQKSDFMVDENTHSLALTASQKLFAGGVYLHLYKADKLLRGQALSLWNQTKNQVLLDLAKTYIAVLREQEAVALQSKFEVVRKRQVDITKSHFNSGTAILSDLKLAESALAGSQAELVGAKAKLKVAETQLTKVLGNKIENPKLDWPELAVSVPENLSEVLDRSLKDNPFLLAAEKQMKAQKEKYLAGKGARLPAVDLVAGASIAEAAFFPTEEYYVGLNVYLPVFSSGRTRYTVVQHAALYKREEALYEQTLREIEANAIAVWEIYQAALTAQKAYKKALLAIEGVAESIKQDYEAGKRTTLDVLNADQDVLEAKLNLTTIRGEIITSLIELLVVMGTPYEDLGYVTDENSK